MLQDHSDDYYMKKALVEAQKAKELDVKRTNEPLQ